MPQLVLEYTKNVDCPDIVAVLRALNRVVLASNLFNERDIKSRGLCLDDFCIGVEERPLGFVHLKLSILTGRSESDRHMLAQGLLKSLQTSFERQADQITVEIAEMTRATYQKWMNPE